MSRQAKFTTGSTMGHVATMTGTGMVGLMALFFVDALNLFYISLLGHTALAAAIGFAGTLQFFTISVSIGLAIAATALVSRAVGAGDRAEARRLASSSMVVLLGVLTVVSGAVLIWREPALAALGARGEALEVGSRFLLVVLPSLPLLGAGMIASSLLRSIGEARLAMLVTLAGGAVGAVLDPLLIFGLDLGVDGAAITSLLSRAAIAAIGMKGVLVTHDLMARPTVRDVRRHAPALLRIAGPAVATQLSTPTGLAALTAAMAAFGDAAVAGWAVVGRIAMLAFGGIFSLSAAVGPIIGQNLGAGLGERVRSTYRDALLFCTAYVLGAWALLIVARPWIVEAFGLRAEGVVVIDAFVLFGAGMYVFTGGLFVANAAFNTLGRPLWATGLNWSRDAVALPLLAMTLPPMFGAEGVVAAQALAALVVGGVGTWLGWRMAPRLASGRPGRALGAEPPAFASGRSAAAVQIGAEADWRDAERDDR